MTTWSRPPAAQEGAGYVLPMDPSDEVGRAAAVLVAARAWVPPQEAKRAMSSILERARARAQGARR